MKDIEREYLQLLIKDVIREVDDLRETLDTTTGVSYTPCIIHILLYNSALCDNNCPQNNLCRRMHYLEVLK